LVVATPTSARLHRSNSWATKVGARVRIVDVVEHHQPPGLTVALQPAAHRGRGLFRLPLRRLGQTKVSGQQCQLRYRAGLRVDPRHQFEPMIETPAGVPGRQLRPARTPRPRQRHQRRPAPPAHRIPDPLLLHRPRLPPPRRTRDRPEYPSLFPGRIQLLPDPLGPVPQRLEYQHRGDQQPERTEHRRTPPPPAHLDQVRGQVADQTHRHREQGRRHR
jgi:hypothetical protein